MSQFIQYQPELWQVDGVTVPIGARTEYGQMASTSARRRFGGVLIASTISASLILGAITLPSDQSWSSRLIWPQGASLRVEEAQVPAGYWNGLARARNTARTLSEEFDDHSAPLV